MWGVTVPCQAKYQGNEIAQEGIITSALIYLDELD